MTTALAPGGFVNRMPRYEILSEEAMTTIERGWRRLMSEVGVRFDHRGAQQLFRRAGQDVDDEGVVRLDPDFVLEQIALAPESFELRARNPARSVTIGGDHMVFTNVAGPPFVYEDGARRDALLSDFERFMKLAHVYRRDRLAGRPAVRAVGSTVRLAPPGHAGARPLTISDKPHMGALFDGWKARDGLALRRSRSAGEKLERGPA